MTTEPKLLYCVRCGDEILPSEQSNSSDTICICAFCEHMMLEAEEIYRVKNKPPTPPKNNRYKISR